MKTVLAIVCAMSVSFCLRAQQKQLQDVQQARVTARRYAYKMAWDSACYAFRKLVASDKYANPYDHLYYSYCSLKRGDTALFARYLGKAISGGIDTQNIRSYYKTLTAREEACLDTFVKSAFDSLHRAFIANHDSMLLYELKCIHEMDQMVRTPIEKWIAKFPGRWKTDSNIYYLSLAAKFADSLNYTRIMRLFASGRFPGYHSCGAAVTDLGLALMHFDQPYVDWEYVLKTLKKAVQNGDIDPDQVTGIVDRHYLGLDHPCYYYGRLKWGAAYPFYDCKAVDALRAEIGQESLKAEYERDGRPLPECYTRK